MPSNPYGPRFWLTYLANTALMVAVSLLFRYADFIAALGGTEEQLGMITGIGMVGAIFARCFQGIAIDRYGAGRIWVLSLTLLVACLLGHLLVDSLAPPAIYILRILYTVSLAGAFGSSITFITLQAPANRMGEMIGMLGSSGFLGMAAGPFIGDWLFAETEAASLASTLFYYSTAAATCSWCCAVCASFGQMRGHGKSHVEHPLQLIRQFHPGWTLVIGCAMGIGIGMPMTFLSAFAMERNIDELRWFWMPYALIAFAVRIATRTLADRWGTRPTILVGMTSLAFSMLAYLAVTSKYSLVFPAAIGGIAHAFLFPAAVAEGNNSFPTRHRGLATTLILTMFDMGLLFGQPIFGWTVELTRTADRSGYTVAFIGMATTLLTVAWVYSARKPQPSLQ